MEKIAGCLVFALLGVIHASHHACAAQSSPNHKPFAGKASYYSHGQKTASGSAFDPAKLTAAHRTLPFGTRVRVTDPKSGRNVIVTINDRGPFIKERVLDVSLGAAKLLGMVERGVMSIVAEIAVPMEPVEATSVASKPLEEDPTVYGAK